MNKVNRSVVKHKSSKSNSGKKRNGTRRRKKDNRKELSLWIAGAVVAVLALVTLLFRWEDSSRETGAKVPQRGATFAVDLSHHNSGKIVWDSLRVMIDRRGNTTKSVNDAQDIVPVTYVILKASEGNSLKDKKFKKNWKAAGKAGYGRGAYHFFRTSKDPVTQAKNYIKTVGELSFSDLPPILDIETTHKGYSKIALNNDVLTWLEIVEKHYARKPIIYSSEAYMRDILSEKITSSYPLWVARYREERPDREGWAMWQFSDRALVYGIDGPVDLNIVSKKLSDKRF